MRNTRAWLSEIQPSGSSSRARAPARVKARSAPRAMVSSFTPRRPKLSGQVSSDRQSSATMMVQSMRGSDWTEEAIESVRSRGTGAV